MKKTKIYFLIAGLICVFLSISGCLTDNDKEAIMSLKEFVDDFVEYLDNESKIYYGGYQTFDAGDTVIIRDNITEIKYNGMESWMGLESMEEGGFPVEGDIRFSIRQGDNVEITLHIIEVNFTTTEFGDEPVVAHLETIQEGWDQDNNTTKSLPQDIIRVIK